MADSVALPGLCSPSWASLPDAAVRRVFEMLSAPSAAALGSTCKEFLKIERDDALWRLFCQRAWVSKRPHRWCRHLEKPAESPPGGWRETFIAAHVDGRRTDITVGELVSFDWVASYHSQWEDDMVRRVVGPSKASGFFCSGGDDDAAGFYHNGKVGHPTVLRWALLRCSLSRCASGARLRVARARHSCLPYH